MRKIVLLALVVAGLLAAMASTRWLTRPPQVRPANGMGQFDALRAKDRLARVLGDEAPHPADTAASDGVRARLVAELRAMGLQPRVDDRFACNKLHKQRGVSCARVRNVLVTVGPASQRPHLLINSHYDSVPVGPGASDAGLGVAAMLEAASLLKNRPLVRNVTFLFNEGEELGLVGARAFLDGNPLSRKVDALINLEARGTTGPVNMFETSVPNAAAVKLFKESVRRPVANSLAVSAYRLIPNYTDVNTFAEERQWLTLNFAPIGNETRYHSPGDDLEAVDSATLQHMGDQLVAVASNLGSRATHSAWQDGNETLFMNVGTRWLLTMEPGSALAILAGLAIGWGLRRAFAKERRPLRGLLLALPLMLGALLLSVAAAYAGLTLLGLLREGQFWRAYPKLSELAVYAGGIAAGLVITGLARRLAVSDLRRAWWLFFVLAGLAFTAFAPGALIYFIFPPLIFAVGAQFQSRWRHAEAVASILAAVAVFVTLGAMLGLLQELVNGGPLWLFAIFGNLVLMPWLIEARPLVEDLRRRRLVGGAAAFATLAWVPAALAPAYSADRQQQWTLQYVIDPAQRQPLWSIVNDRKPLPDEWRRFGDWRLATIESLDRRRRWIAPAAPVAGVVPARALPFEATSTAGGRRIRLRLQPNGADTILLLAREDADVRALGVPGQLRPIGKETSGPFRLSCTGGSCAGQVVELLVGPTPVALTVVGSRWTLPPAARPLQAARPRHARPQYLPDATITVERLRV